MLRFTARRVCYLTVSVHLGLVMDSWIVLRLLQALPLTGNRRLQMFTLYGKLVSKIEDSDNGLQGQRSVAASTKGELFPCMLSSKRLIAWATELRIAVGAENVIASI